MKELLICADDYGLSPGVSSAILQLASRRKIHAASCMTIFSDWPRWGQLAKQVGAPFQWGLHICVTGERLKPLLGAPPNCGYLSPKGYFLSWPKLASRLIAGKVDRKLLYDEMQAQWTAFVQVMGTQPQFLDGHHHSQLLPGLDRLYLNLIRDNRPETPLRSTYQPSITLLGSFNFNPSNWLHSLSGMIQRSRFRKAGVLSNEYYFGLTGGSLRSPAKVKQFCAKGEGQVIWSVHPGFVDAELIERDSLLKEREREWQALLTSI